MKIGIVGAMDEEIAILKERIAGQNKTVAGYDFFAGTLERQEVILVKSGIGKVNAAISTTLLNQLFNPDIVINTGSAGGLNKDLEVGDIVISSKIAYHDVDVTAFDYKLGQIPGMPEYFSPDTNLVQVAEKCAVEVTDSKVVKGMIVSGDSFMSSDEEAERIRHAFPDVHAVEMEASAVAHVCYQFATPLVIIRAISDVADKEAPMSFEQFLKVAAKNSSELIIRMVRALN